MVALDRHGFFLRWDAGAILLQPIRALTTAPCWQCPQLSSDWHSAKRNAFL